MNRHPANLTAVTVGQLDGGFDHVEHDRRYVATDAIALDVRDDREVRNVDRVVRIDRDGLAIGGHIDMIVLHEYLDSEPDRPTRKRGRKRRALYTIAGDDLKC